MNKRELPPILEHDFVITDESLNRKGWRIIVAGIDLTGFKMNPVCCVEHDMRMIPIGKWKNLRVDGDKLKGTVEFDRNDPDAIKLYWKYKDGYMNAVSLHVLPVEESKEPSMLAPGQKYSTLTKSEMLEISLVTVPGQKNAVKLSSIDGKEYKLSLLTSNYMNFNGQSQKDKVCSLIEEYRHVISAGEIEALTSLAKNNYQFIKNILERRKSGV